MAADLAAMRILRKLLEEACEESVLPAIIQEKHVRALFGRAENIMPNKNSELQGRSAIVDRRGLDIYGQEKTNDIKYFTCKNCERQISGNRFAAHVAKCVTRGRRPRSTFT